MKRISCAILIVCILGVLGPTRASVRAQNSSTSEHSVGEIIDWIIKNAVLNSRYDKDGSGMSEETGVFRQPEACTLAIQTIKSSRTPSTRGHYGGKTVAI